MASRLSFDSKPKKMQEGKESKCNQSAIKRILGNGMKMAAMRTISMHLEVEMDPAEVVQLEEEVAQVVKDYRMLVNTVPVPLQRRMVAPRMLQGQRFA
jgi:hypothetical protein